MLERFKVPPEDRVLVSEPSLREAVTSIFERMGVAPEDAAQGADVLVAARPVGSGDPRRLKHAGRVRAAL